MAYEKELEFAKSLALEAGDVMRQYFGFEIQREWKADTTPVTKADTEINALVIQRVQDEFSGDAVLGEEDSLATGSDRVWVCDPVDGTMPYSHGVQISTFSLALVVDGTPCVGVIYDPFMDRLFWAVSGGGAYCNSQEIHVSTGGFEHALIDVEGFPAVGKRSVLAFRHGRVEQALEAKGAKITHFWSMILPSALTAAGQYSAVLFNIGNPHDIAAAKIIVEEAGGKVTDLHGNEQRYDQKTKGAIISNGVVHNELVQIIASCSE
jgi:fructose-1,6-bisphosphatase/inositol monophosphatase family enzyme